MMEKIRIVLDCPKKIMMASNSLILHSFVMQAADGSDSKAKRRLGRPEQRAHNGIQNRAAENIVFESTQTISSEFFIEFVIKREDLRALCYTFFYMYVSLCALNVNEALKQAAVLR